MAVSETLKTHKRDMLFFSKQQPQAFQTTVDVERYLDQKATERELSRKALAYQDFIEFNDHDALAKEFNNLFETLKANGQDRRTYWLYLYYWCKMLEAMHSSYSGENSRAALDYRDKAGKIVERLANEPQEQQVQANDDAPVDEDQNEGVGQTAGVFGSLASIPGQVANYLNPNDWYNWVFSANEDVLEDDDDITSAAIPGVNPLEEGELSDENAEGEQAQEETDPEFILFGIDVGRMQKDFFDFLAMPGHTSDIKSWLITLHVTRIYLAFCRMTSLGIINFMYEMDWIRHIEKFFDQPIDLAIMDTPVNTFNFLSVALLAARFLVNIGLMFKHVFCPTDEERNLDWTTRLRIEWEKRYPQLLNDVLWGTGNLLANYAALFNIPIPIANALMGVFLCFDLGMMLHLRYRSRQEYLSKKAQYTQEMDDLRANEARLLERLEQGDEVADKLRRIRSDIALLNEQLFVLEQQYAKESAIFLVYTFGAVLTLTSYSMLLFISVPMTAFPFLFLAIVCGFSLYYSANLYGDHAEKSWLLEQATLHNNDGENDEEIAVLEKEVSDALFSFTWSFVENAAVPALLMAMYAINLPMAVVCTVAYIGWKVACNYRSEAKEVAPAEVYADGRGEPDVNAVAALG